MFPLMSQAFPAMAAVSAPAMQGFITPFQNPWGYLSQLMQGIPQFMPQYEPQQPPAQPTLQQAMTGGAPMAPEQYQPLFAAASQKYNVPQNLLEAVAHQESRFRPNARSPVGAQGMMQLMPDTARGLGVTNAYDPAQNINGGARYLRQMLDMFGGDYRLALAAYNAGPGRVRQYKGVPPFKETRNYVQTIMGRLGQ